jgi:uncharacterized protein (DUF58 family)
MTVGTPRVTRLGLLPLVGAGALGGLATVTGDAWLLLLAAACVGVVAGALVLRPRLSGLRVSVSTPPRASVGEQVVTQLQVHNVGRRTASLTRVRHHVDGLDDVTVLLDPIPPGGRAAATLTRTATNRAVSRAGLVTLSSSAPLGLVQLEAVSEVDQDLVVHPAVARVPPAPAGEGADQHGRPVRSRSGLDVHGVRDWRRGDDTSQVHWRSTARRGRLVVLEREEPRGGRLTVCVVGPEGTPDWEPLVSAVASLAVATVRDGRPVRLLASDPGSRDWREQVCGQDVEVLDWCAALQTVRPPDLPSLSRLALYLGRGDLTVALTIGGQAWWDAAQPSATADGLRFVPLVVRPVQGTRTPA